MREREFTQAIVDEFLALVDDLWVERTRKHSLETILVISLLAVICGADGLVAIERYAIAKESWHSAEGRVGGTANKLILNHA